ncbi:MAG: tetratricopeptide repeat protein [Gammaproteobacteria bacterium]
MGVGREIAQEVSPAFSRGADCLEGGEYRKAIKLFEEAIDSDPYHVNAYILCGQAHFYLSDDDRAISLFNSALSFNRNDEATLAWRGLAYINKKQFGKAIGDFSEAIIINPALDYFYQRGSSYLNLDDYGKALADFLQVLTQDPERKDVYVMLESCLLEIIKIGLLNEINQGHINSAIKFLPKNKQIMINNSINKTFIHSGFSLWGSGALSAATINDDIGSPKIGITISFSK